ncbi:RNA polymerase subunit sigma-70 [Corallococcus sp. H22C18031201]|uniref:sigma-70 family RNA polymerase sigma factor n=1 Tax=Citreicoccus inhibens TaxID=2849499 RepID=UPI000E70FDF3|nr:sigma-70 family RNA polymerase sigma factor [Citreicoccus inhibens]MBU8894026.1 sigma-70 family RNA polymerase sigma factor [Citreicoccus inhibens]RJS23251.1 RNA polymerase subunit sigma-70 [Corallococcus sp. H22C18031201]
MTAHLALATRFEEQRGHLRSVAFRMLGGMSEADDAVQEAWLHASRADTQDVQNLGGWLTTVVARVCLDQLRARKSRPEDPVGAQVPVTVAGASNRAGPEEEALQADAVGLALLVVLETLEPAERVAFVLHDMFDVSFDDIATIVGRSVVATRQLASRARRRVKGAEDISADDLASQRSVVDAFLAALRANDLDGVLAVLDPEVVVCADRESLPPGAALELRGARAAAMQSIALSRGAKAARVALIEGAVGLVVAPLGRLYRILRFTQSGGRITRIDVIGEVADLHALTVSTLDA